MPIRNNIAQSQPNLLHGPVVLAADDTTTDTSSVDLSDSNAVTVRIAYGTAGDTLSSSVKFSVKLQESDDDSTFTDVAAAECVTTAGLASANTFGDIDDLAEDNAIYSLGYIGNARYLRARITSTGSHVTGTPLMVWADEESLREAPGTVLSSPA